MNAQTLEKMKQMKFYGMYHAFKTALETDKLDGYTIDEFVGFLVDHEHDDRHNRRINRLVTNAKFRYKANLEDLSYHESRQLDKNRIMRLASCEFIKSSENLIITGSTGVGKSFLASALGHHACSQGYRVAYFNAAKLFARLKIAKADGSYIKEMAKIERQDVLLLDDFCLQPMDRQARHILLDLVEDRHGKSSMIITSQYPTDTWHELIGDNTVADAILDRIVHTAQRISLQGESMRRRSTKTTPENQMQIIN